MLLLSAVPTVGHAGFLRLAWNAPTTNADGSPLRDLQGYRVYVGTSMPSCPGASCQALNAPARSPAPGDRFSATLTALTPGTTYVVRVSAVDTSGNESACSPSVSGVALAGLDVTPAALTFGSVRVGSASTLDLTVQNLGPTAVTGSVTTAAPFSIVLGGSLSVAPGASQVVRVRFAPLTGQTFVGSVNITTSAGNVSRPASGVGATAVPAVLQFSRPDYPVIEGGTATITVTRTGGTHGGVTVNYTTGNGTAAAGADYTAAAGTLTFAANQARRTFTVTTRQDTAVEGSETIALALSNPGGGAVLGAASRATVTITDDEPNLRFRATSYTVAETAGAATITVSRAGSTAGVVTVGYATTATGSATPGPGGDFTPVAGTLTFAAGQTSRTFTVPVLDDDVADGAKTVGLRLTNPVGAGLGTPSTATLTITDSDVAGTIQFGAVQYVADEGAGTYQVPVKRTGGTAAGARAAYTVTGGSATPGIDFTVGGSGSVTFGRGVTQVMIPITVVGDALLEGSETLVLTLSNPAGGAALGVMRRTTVTIDETAFEFATAAYTVTEGGVATITVARRGPASRSATIEWVTSDGTATAGSDYTPGSGTLTFPAGIRTRTFTVATAADTLPEGAETVLLVLRNPSAGTIRGAQRTAVLTIADNDAGERIAFGAASHVVAESRRTYDVTVVRTGGAASGVTVDYAVVGGTATGGGGDYSLAGGTVTFAAGQKSALIRLLIVDDGVAESDETVILRLGNPTGEATLGTPSSTTVTITDNDRTATVQFGAAVSRALEGAASALSP
ncbi:MAG TPA: Calx-beta domain-containing protein [Methylomirabilota bacterium]|nr:Calx-beta domain-containing protein [Methylomirabilota bacterium]